MTFRLRHPYVLSLLATTLLVACGRDSTPLPDSSGASAAAPSPARPDSSAAAPALPSPAGLATVSERGIGPVKIGMTLAEARAATGGSLSAPPAADTASCGFATWKGPAVVRMMTAGGHIVRVDVDSGTATTDAGARIGDTEARIAELYVGRVETTPHKYKAGGHYLTIKPAAPADSAYRVIFETNGSRVTTFRAGRLPEVGFVEGCG
ncbi:hypothetical protein BH09GEM1_BH09GEM1_26170 [soil metagenome]